MVAIQNLKSAGNPSLCQLLIAGAGVMIKQSRIDEYGNVSFKDECYLLYPVTFTIIFISA